MADPDTRTWDVAVVGTGPAGATASRVLARAGASVLLLEQAELPRYKPCGGGLVGRATLRLKGIPVAPEAVCHRARLTFPDHNLGFVTQRDEPIITMVMRPDFDLTLTHAATAAGATLATGCTVTGVTRTPSNVTLETSQGRVRARAVVAADGVGSRVATAGGWGRLEAVAPALEWEVPVTPRTLARFSGEARFDFVMGGAYAWVFPKRDHLSVGIMGVGPAGDLNRAMTHYLKRLGIRPMGEVARHGHRIPLAPRPGPLGRDGILLTGDAAGLADPVTGEGISYALESGGLAAEALLGADFDPARAANAYQDRLRETLLPELAAARPLARLLYGYPRAVKWGFSKYGQRVCERITDVIAGRGSYRGLLDSRLPEWLKHLAFPPR